MGSSDDEAWIAWYCAVHGNEFFCEVDIEYVKDRFNLWGLSDEVRHFSLALDMIIDVDQDGELNRHPVGDPLEGDIMEQAMVLYGLIHARYILTKRGMAKMLDKFDEGEFGHCPRVYCERYPMLPVGLSDTRGEAMVKLYCPKCKDVYTPKSTRYHIMDGAYFGTGFPHMVFMMHPELRPKPSPQYVPRIHGFKIHPLAYQLQQQASTTSKTSPPTVLCNARLVKAGSGSPPPPPPPPPPHPSPAATAGPAPKTPLVRTKRLAL